MLRSALRRTRTSSSSERCATLTISAVTAAETGHLVFSIAHDWRGGHDD
ncbi:MAG: hypothetical protein ACLVL7_00690 [Anaerotruncus massiliensis (ex Togo et al. 2019)]